MDTRVELNDEELKKVCAGFSEQNGLYSLNYGDFFVKDSGNIKETWRIMDNYHNITLDTEIVTDWTRETDGVYSDAKIYRCDSLRSILRHAGVKYVGNDI